jgi:hypothetical protein
MGRELTSATLIRILVASFLANRALIDVVDIVDIVIDIIHIGVKTIHPHVPCHASGHALIRGGIGRPCGYVAAIGTPGLIFLSDRC